VDAVAGSIHPRHQHHHLRYRRELQQLPRPHQGSRSMCSRPRPVAQGRSAVEVLQGRREAEFQRETLLSRDRSIDLGGVDRFGQVLLSL
jgi:hypothetical protein